MLDADKGWRIVKNASQIKPNINSTNELDIVQWIEMKHAHTSCSMLKTHGSQCLIQFCLLLVLVMFCEPCRKINQNLNNSDHNCASEWIFAHFCTNTPHIFANIKYLLDKPEKRPRKIHIYTKLLKRDKPYFLSVLLDHKIILFFRAFGGTALRTLVAKNK